MTATATTKPYGTYATTKIVANRSANHVTSQPDQVLIDGVPLSQYMADNPCETKMWNRSYCTPQEGMDTGAVYE